MRTIITLLGGMLAFAPLALAQTDAMCPALVEAAYAAAALECEQVEPGTACYGSRSLTVTALGSGNFTRPGHRIGGVKSLESGPMDAASGEWGIAILNVPANAPDQTLTMIVLGAVTLTDTSGADAPVSTVPVRVTFSGGANLRARPAEDAELVAPLVMGQIIPAVGRLADDSWLRLFLDDGRSGWVRADLVSAAGDLDWLPVVTATSQPPETLYSPLQAFDLITAADDAPCSDAPDSGL
ncbi:MAG TPA: SH3 domain-containing protein, partial [Spirillospora sp.]|nr:SH3 domain-containing protein [Spirillospora sp.]